MPLRGAQFLSINFDYILLGIGLRSKLSHNMTIYRDAALDDQFLGVAGRCDAGMSQDFLKTLVHSIHCTGKRGQSVADAKTHTSSGIASSVAAWFLMSSSNSSMVGRSVKFFRPKWTRNSFVVL